MAREFYCFLVPAISHEKTDGRKPDQSIVLYILTREWLKLSILILLEKRLKWCKNVSTLLQTTVENQILTSKCHAQPNFEHIDFSFGKPLL